MRRPGQRHMCGLFADRDVKDFLFAIYALYHELETITPRTQEFSLGGSRFEMAERNFVSV